MTAILDKKSRILDTLITQEGRKQLFTGKLQIKFAAFSDAATFYRGDIVSGSDDAQSRIYFEATSLPRDQITFESDDSGKLKSYRGSEFLGILGGKILSGTNEKFLEVVTDQDIFDESVPTLLSSSIENFNKLRIIKSADFFLDNDDFILSRNRIDYTATDTSPLNSADIQEISVDDAESLFQDRRMSHVPNFTFLPPQNKPTIMNPNGSSLGNFLPLGERKILTFEDLVKELPDNKETVEFLATSRENNVIAQFFEVRQKELSKLDIIDFGLFPSKDSNNPDKHVFFAGKLFIDSKDTHTFINMFTLVFE